MSSVLEMGFCKKVLSHSESYMGKFLERRRASDQSEPTILGRFPERAAVMRPRVCIKSP
jgi:hypothetical protein